MRTCSTPGTSERTVRDGRGMERNNKEQTGTEIQKRPRREVGRAPRVRRVCIAGRRTRGFVARTLRYSSKPMRLLPSLSSALNMSTAAALSELLLRALRSSDESISPLPSASASSNTALRAKISFLLYFLDILDSAPDMSVVGETRRAWRGHRRVASGGNTLHLREPTTTVALAWGLAARLCGSVVYQVYG